MTGQNPCHKDTCVKLRRTQPNTCKSWALISIHRAVYIVAQSDMLISYSNGVPMRETCRLFWVGEIWGGGEEGWGGGEGGG